MHIRQWNQTANSLLNIVEQQEGVQIEPDIETIDVNVEAHATEVEPQH